ncbi:glycogenin glucosyltransferase [Elasticomyces elasticus]|nr:glycogenin glucosyltransferase [Elasticomyces elasticus]
MVTMDSLRATTITELKSLYDFVLPVERISNPNPSNLYLMKRSDLLFAFTKVNLWRLTQFRKIIYIDADVVALRAPDELFDLGSSFAAAPDVGWPDAFNSGVMALTPHMGDYWALKTLASTGDSFDGADQGLLNQYYEHRDWQRISFTYNCTPSANYQYEPAYRYHKSKISMVHFIGAEKPWLTGRTRQRTPGAYNELLGRWWAVYDRHFKASTTDYISGEYAPASTTVQSQVKGEAISADHGYSYTTLSQPMPEHAVQPEPGFSHMTADQPFTDPGEMVESIERGVIEPTPTAQVRRFSAPHMEWDATRAPPPSDAKPEAANFPSDQYPFNEDPNLFRAPQSYPEPPKDMWYEVPKEKPAPPEEKPKPIFPWEEREDRKPTRVFAEDMPAPQPELVPEPTPALTSLEDEEQSPPNTTPMTPAANVFPDEPFAPMDTKNAWDEVAGIDEYVRALTAAQRNRGKVQVLHTTGEAPTRAPGFISKRERRESLILTDFPTAVERPSLPVTPAPLARPNFWSDGRDEAGQLPGAQGVPDQADWDPAEKLEELRRNSLIGPGDLKLTPIRHPGKRDMPPSSMPIPEAALAYPHVPLSGGGSPHGLEKHVKVLVEPTAVVPSASAVPNLTMPDFGSSSTTARGRAMEDVLSPTEHGSRSFGENI